jgi:iron complex outermembrane receptor protein
VTRDPADTLGRQGSISLGENGIRDVQARIGWGEVDRNFRLTADTRGDDGLSGANGQNSVSRVNFRSDFLPNGTDELQLRLGGLNIGSGTGLSNNPGNPFRDFAFDSSYVQLDWRRSLGTGADLALQLSHSQEAYKDEFPFALRLLSPVFSVNDIYTVRADGRASSDVVMAQYTWRPGSTTRAVFGSELRTEYVESGGLYNTTDAFKTSFGRLFGNLEWRAAPNWLINAGAMAERHSVSGDTLAPRLMANWHAATGHTWRVGVSKAFRPPSTFEDFADIRFIWNGRELSSSTRSSGDLRSEQVLSREVSYLGDFPDLQLNLNARLFREEVTNFIRFVKEVTPNDYGNKENFVIRGLEYQLKLQPWVGARFLLNQSFTDISSQYKGIGTAAPQLGSSIAYFQRLAGNLDLSLMHTHNKPASLVADSKPQTIRRTDLRLAKGFHWGSHRGEIALVVQNLGSTYPDYREGVLFEKQAFITLRLDN